jgi:hypothetical protein
MMSSSRSDSLDAVVIDRPEEYPWRDDHAMGGFNNNFVDYTPTPEEIEQYKIQKKAREVAAQEFANELAVVLAADRIQNPDLQIKYPPEWLAYHSKENRTYRPGEFYIAVRRPKQTNKQTNKQT